MMEGNELVYYSLKGVVADLPELQRARIEKAKQKILKIIKPMDELGPIALTLATLSLDFEKEK